MKKMNKKLILISIKFIIIKRMEEINNCKDLRELDELIKLQENKSEFIQENIARELRRSRNYRQIFGFAKNPYL
jgi:hypothetical protein